MKLLCVLLPHFPWQCEVRRHNELRHRPVVIARADGSQKIVLDHAPELASLRNGMPLQEALSLEGDSTVIPADVPYYGMVFSEILDALMAVSPLVEGADPGEIYLGRDGLQLLYPTAAALVAAVRAAMPADLTARIGMAEGKFPAYLAACRQPSSAAYAELGDNPPVFLQDLSVDLLPVSWKTREKLHDFGLKTLGQVAALAAGPLLAQFGPEGKRLCELARGNDTTPLYPRVVEETIAEQTTLTSVTTSLEVMLMAIEVLLTRAFTKFEAKGMGIRSIRLFTRSWRAEHWERHINFKEPAMNIKTALTRIKQIMENSPQPGPVEQLGMEITGLAGQRGKQKSLFTELRAQDHLREDIRQLELRLGGPQLYTVKEVEPWSRIPERRYALTPLSR